MFGKTGNFKVIKKIISTVTALGIVFASGAGLSFGTVSAETENLLVIDKSVLSDPYHRSFIGQRVMLEKGKTYEFSYYYTDSYIETCVFDVGETPIEKEVTEDAVYNKRTARFTVPDDGAEGKKSVYVGIRAGWSDNGYVNNRAYCARFNLCNVETPETNLLSDAGLEAKYDGWYLDDSIWKDPYNDPHVRDYFWVDKIASFGGIDLFNRNNENYRKVISLNSTDPGWFTFGQLVTLELGKTYEFSYNYSGDSSYPLIFKDYLSETQAECNKTEDDAAYKKTATFTVTDDALDGENGKKLIWVGISSGAPAYSNTYYYDFKLADISNPDENLFSDAGWIENGNDINKNIWKNMWGYDIDTKFSKTTLGAIGGKDIFIKTYTVSFNTLSDTEVAQQVLNFGNVVAEPEAPVKSGAIFRGWYSDAEYTKAWNFAEDTVSEDVTLTAKWLLKGDANGSGKVDVKDLIRVKKHLAGFVTLTGDNLLAADIAGEETITSEDMAMLWQHLLGALAIE